MNASLNSDQSTEPDDSMPSHGRVDPSTRRRGWIRIAGIVAIAVVSLAAASTTIKHRLSSEASVNPSGIAPEPPIVTVATVRPSPEDNVRVLPGNALPLLEAGLFPRATGYIKTRLVDIGDHVEQGQLLAEISAPDLDDQLSQAKANLAAAEAGLPLAKANARVAQTTLERYTSSGPGSFSLLLIDQQRATVETTNAQVEVAKASIEQNKAAVQQFSDLQSFEKIAAPFAGVITARNFDPGDLVMANSTTRELLHLMRTDILRVLVNVPQVFATGIQVGQDATVYQRDDPSQEFAGKVTRTADALDPNTRTLLTEVQVPNPENKLRPGMYLMVKFSFRRVTPTVRIPNDAVVIRDGPPMVAQLDAQHEVHYRKVQLGRDYGDEIEILAGLKSGDTVVVHSGDDIPEGTIVEPASLPK
jgi:RND family efflux transporter MFP subunit